MIVAPILTTGVTFSRFLPWKPPVPVCTMGGNTSGSKAGVPGRSFSLSTDSTQALQPPDPSPQLSSAKTEFSGHSGGESCTDSVPIVSSLFTFPDLSLSHPAVAQEACSLRHPPEL